jgi:hypothetical protein
MWAIGWQLEARAGGAVWRVAAYSGRDFLAEGRGLLVVAPVFQSLEHLVEQLVRLPGPAGPPGCAQGPPAVFHRRFHLAGLQKGLPGT